jgi:hypothetical protein
VTGWAAGVIEAHATLSRTLSAERFTDLAKQARAYFQKARSFSEKVQHSAAKHFAARRVKGRAATGRRMWIQIFRRVLPLKPNGVYGENGLARFVGQFSFASSIPLP